MKKFARLDYDNFIINGEVNERLPLYNEFIENIYPLEGTMYNLNPDFQVMNGEITHGVSSKLMSKQNVSVSNNIMTFNGTNSSYIELEGDVCGAKIIDIEIKFKLNGITKAHTIFSSNPFSISFDNTNKRLYATINSIKGQYSSIGDIESNKFSLTDNNSIKSNTWYTIKIYKYNRTTIVYLDDTNTRTFILDADFNTDNCFLGKGLDGQIEFLNIRDKSHIKINDISIPSKATQGDYSVCFNFKKNGSNYRLIKIGELEINFMNDNIMTFNTEVFKLSEPIQENVLYGVSIGYSNGTAKIIIYNMDAGTVLTDLDLSINANSSNILTNANIGVFNLAIYNKRLSDKILLEQYKKGFRLDKSGDIRYEIDEVSGHDKLKVNVGKKYHMQLTKDLNSNCKTIINNKQCTFVDGGVESKNKDKKIQLSFADAVNMPNTWHLIYKTKITALTDGTHYDSLGEGLYWGIEDNKFAVKYVNGQSILTSYIPDLIAKTVLNEWIIISLSYQSSLVTLTVCTSKGIFSVNLSKQINSIKGSSYDLFLGGRQDILCGEAIYRELNIITNWNVDMLYIENMFRTKLSYSNNKLISNVNIIEE